MKKIYSIFILLLFISLNGFSQTITFNGCHDLFNDQDYIFNNVGTDATGRSIFRTTPIDGQACGGLGTCEFEIAWNVANNRWEFTADSGNGNFANPFLIYYNSEATSPNPPDLNSGVWYENTAITQSSCGGDLTALNCTLIGDVQSSEPPNTAPTAASFTATPTQNLVYTFATSDFGYADDDSDPIHHLRITTVPASGTLFADANTNDSYDTGEELANGAMVSKADLDAGNLQYITSNANASSFVFDVNDGTDYSTSTYTVTLTVTPIATFTAPNDLCINAGIQTSLGGGLPSGGVYSGAGVTDDGNGSTYSFDPFVAGVGTHTISYTNGTTANDDVEVFAAPNAELITATHNGPVDVGTDLVFTIVAPANTWVYIAPNSVYPTGAAGVNGSTITFTGASLSAPSQSIVLTKAVDAITSCETILDKTILAVVNNALPAVSTQTVTEITTNSATGNGTITNLGAPNPTQYGICWSTSTEPTTSGNHT
ncbi:MAG: hypothetical protein JW729_03775, partial [Bacteroidales bacterium]|nr:hypothetical protein [Bacteroidales bacterium]